MAKKSGLRGSRLRYKPTGKRSRPFLPLVLSGSVSFVAPFIQGLYFSPTAYTQLLPLASSSLELPQV